MLSKNEFETVNAKAAEGDPDSLMRMAVHYLTDTVNGPDLCTAHKWLERASAAGNAVAHQLRSASQEPVQSDLRGTQKRFWLLPACILVLGVTLICLLVWIANANEWLNRAGEAFGQTSEASNQSGEIPISGAWQGYYIQNGSQTNFTLTITESGSSISGTVRERTGHSNVRASDISGSRHGTQIELIKSYRSNGTRVSYDGNLDPAATTIDGTWVAGNLSGRWHASRAQLSNERKGKRGAGSTAH